MNEKQAKNFETLTKLLEVVNRPGLKNMMNEIGLQYATAPASSRQEFHLCEPGGLMQHSLNVVRNLMKISEALAPGKFKKEILIFVALFHDLGKVGDGENEYYVLTNQDWKKKRGELYDINKNCVWMPTSERGLFIMQKFDVKLTSDEYLAIRLNDGQYEDTNRSYRSKEPDLAVLLHMADMWACRQEKAEFKEISE